MVKTMCIFNVVEYMVKNNIMTTNTSRAKLNFQMNSDELIQRASPSISESLV